MVESHGSLVLRVGRKRKGYGSKEKRDEENEMNEEDFASVSHNG